VLRGTSFKPDGDWQRSFTGARPLPAWLAKANRGYGQRQVPSAPPLENACCACGQTVAHPLEFNTGRSDDVCKRMAFLYSDLSERTDLERIAAPAY
jgi:hypothetical protein